MKEEDFETILTKYPDLIEDELVVLGRQVTVFGLTDGLQLRNTMKVSLISMMYEDTRLTLPMMTGTRGPSEPRIRSILLS
jgi:hypothetical protein